MKISNRHERVLAATPERVAALVADFEQVWPTQIAPAPRRRGPRLFQAGMMVWEEVDRQSAVRAFRVVSPNGLQAEHWFETEPADGGILLRHTIDGEALGEYEEIWRERIEPGHDRVIEALFDKIEATIQIGTGRPNSEHESPRWRIAEIAPDFRLEDVWTLPAQGGAEDFGALLEVMASLDPAHGESAATRLLFSIRYRLGGWFGWDDATRELEIPGNAETTLSARLPADLRTTATNLDRSSSGFRPLYRTDDEWAAELSNRTVHAVMHLAWVEKGEGRYQGQMAVYVKPRGRFGAAYMALIRPLRHRVVYPALMRQIEPAWNARLAQPIE